MPEAPRGCVGVRYDARVTESFVDLSYRGLSLGRRIKLSQVRPTTGYLEHPTPMPVGTPVAITTDDGLVIDATVAVVHEQVGGSDRAPGMLVKPTLGDAAATWWQARVTLPEEEQPAPAGRTKPITVRPRTHTIPEPARVEAVPEPVSDRTTQATGPELDRPPPADHVTTQPIAVVASELPAGAGKKTTVMAAVDQELLAQLTKEDPAALETLVRRTGEHAVVDDGQRTMIMDAIDPAALGLEASASGSMAAATDEEGEEGGSDDDPGSSQPGTGGSEKKPKGSVKRRKKRR